MADLLPCPFCGGEASATGSVRYSENHEAWWPDGSRIQDAFFVNCMACGCDNRAMVGHQTTEAAIAHWNRRHPSPQPRSDKEGG